MQYESYPLNLRFAGVLGRRDPEVGTNEPCKLLVRDVEPLLIDSRPSEEATECLESLLIKNMRRRRAGQKRG